LKVHEYQAKEIFAAYGLAVPPGRVAATPQEAATIAREIGGRVVVKAQVHVGGRGKAGGVKLAANPAEAQKHAAAILGMDIKGLTVQKVLVTSAVDIAQEFYLGLLMDRGSKRPMFIASAAGGIDIEEVAAKTPEQIHTLSIDPRFGAQAYQARRLAYRVSDDPAVVAGMSKALLTLYRIFIAVDASLVEINPFVKAKDGKTWSVDAKLNIDDNGLYRQPEIEQMRDLSAEDPSEVEAREAGLSFVKLAGNVGCIVNGAGLAMATMDLVQHFGGMPANFLDIGGSSNPDKVVTAMRIILRDKGVRSILFNIFGGITRCDDVAAGLLKATEMMTVPVPIVVRLTGTNEEKARELLKGSKLVTAVTMDEAVKKALELATGGAR
jgi:succinyl-CoA synthetase beta subunit